MIHTWKTISRTWAMTLLELMIVVLIISILATIATGVYSGETQRARVSAAHALIHSLEMAITRYEIDTGSLPPSGSAADQNNLATGRTNGSGLLHLALLHSMSGSALHPSSQSWHGPYINLQPGQLAGAQVSGTASTIDILDPWGLSIRYVNWTDYGTVSTTFDGGTQEFTSTAPAGAAANLPAPNLFAASETYYNPKTFQLVSFGPDGETVAGTAATGTTTGATGTTNYSGTGVDDINNFSF